MSEDISFWKVGAVIAGLATFAVGLTYLQAGMDVASAPARVVSAEMTADAIMSNYESFYDVSAGYETRLPQIRWAIIAESAATGDEKVRLGIELAGAQQMCRSLAAKYNADSRKLNREVMKAHDLPAELSIAACETGTPA